MSGKVTEIRRTEGDPPRLTVFVDGAEAFTVSEEVARELDLSVGSELAERDADRAAADDERSKAREAALRLLSVRARSEGELYDRLRRKGFTDELSAAVIASLIEVGLLDDEAFARAWADERVRLRPVGPRRLVRELLSKQVDRELAGRVVEETFREHSEFDLARRAMQKKTRVSGGVGDKKNRARLHSFLIRRGFSYEVASVVLRELEGESDA